MSASAAGLSGARERAAAASGAAGWMASSNDRQLLSMSGPHSGLGTQPDDGIQNNDGLPFWYWFYPQSNLPGYTRALAEDTRAAQHFIGYATIANSVAEPGSAGVPGAGALPMRSSAAPAVGSDTGLRLTIHMLEDIRGNTIAKHVNFLRNRAVQQFGNGGAAVGAGDGDRPSDMDGLASSMGSLGISARPHASNAAGLARPRPQPDIRQPNTVEELLQSITSHRFKAPADAAGVNEILPAKHHLPGGALHEPDLHHIPMHLGGISTSALQAGDEVAVLIRHGKKVFPPECLAEMQKASDRAAAAIRGFNPEFPSGKPFCPQLKQKQKCNPGCWFAHSEKDQAAYQVVLAGAKQAMDHARKRVAAMWLKANSQDSWSIAGLTLLRMTDRAPIRSSSYSTFASQPSLKWLKDNATGEHPLRLLNCCPAGLADTMRRVLNSDDALIAAFVSDLCVVLAINSGANPDAAAHPPDIFSDDDDDGTADGDGSRPAPRASAAYADLPPHEQAQMRGKLLMYLLAHEPTWKLFERVAHTQSSATALQARARLTGDTTLQTGRDDMLKVLRYALADVPNLMGVAVVKRVERFIASILAIPAFARHQATAIAALFSALGSRLPVADALQLKGFSAAPQLLLQQASYKTNWLALPLIPTAEDIRDPSWLRYPQLPGLKSSYPDVLTYLETLFRLQRADGLEGITTGVSKLSNRQPVDERDLHMYYNLRVLGIRAFGGGVQAAVWFRPRAKVKDLAKAGRLMDGNLLCISTDGLFSPSSLLWGIVAPMCQELLQHQVVIIELIYTGDSSAGLSAIEEIIKYQDDDSAGGRGVQMVESPSFFTSVRYALAKLQLLGRRADRLQRQAAESSRLSSPVATSAAVARVMPAIPFEAELVYLGADARAVPTSGVPASGAHASPPNVAFISGSAAREAEVQPQQAYVAPARGSGHSPAAEYLQGFRLNEATQVMLRMDDSQRMGLNNAFKSRISCTQGPPGTGKTYTSAAFAEIALLFTGGRLPPGPILMTAEKNHALDSFLQRLMQLPQCKDGIARVGGNADSVELARCNLSVLRHEALSACKSKSSTLVGNTDRESRKAFEGASLTKAFRRRGKATSVLKDAQERLTETLDMYTGRKRPVSIPTLCAHADVEQLQALIRRAPEVSGAASFKYPKIPGVDLGEEYAAAVRAVVSACRGGRGPSPAEASNAAGFERSDADASIDMGARIAESLREPLSIPKEQLEAAEWTVSKKGKTNPRPPTPYDALCDALAMWTIGLDSAQVRALFYTANSASSAADPHDLLSVPAARDTVNDDSAAAEAIDAEDAAAALDERRLNDEADDDDDYDGNPQNNNLRNQHPVWSALRDKRVTVFTNAQLGVAGQVGRAAVAAGSDHDGVDPLSRYSFASRPWSTEYSYLGEPSHREKLQALVHHSDVWAMEAHQKAIILHCFAEAAAADAATRRSALLKQFLAAEAELKDAQDAFDAEVLQGKKIIGMTINGAAKYSSLLEKLRVTVVVVEEAAEVPEPLMLAAIPSTAQHMYKAGDHKQLPPQSNYHALDHAPFNLNVSMFERLVVGNFKHGALAIQNRMHPHLANLIRLAGVYEHYNDRTGIGEQRVLPGHMQGHVFWWDHGKLEDGQSQSGGGADDEGGHVLGRVSSATNSHSNKEEALRAASIACLHMINGIHPSRITIITPYAGQVRLVRECLEKTLSKEVIVHAQAVGLPDPKGAPAAASAAAAQPAAAGKGKQLQVRPAAAEMQKPRVCTVDEFQGDENDHIILSLVRNNPRGELGFTKKVNRLTVALSRARVSLVIIGSSQHFSRSNDWQKQVAYLAGGADIGVKCCSKAFPIMCPRHRRDPLSGAVATPVKVANTAEAMPKTFGDNPCRAPCGGRHNCHDRHPCPRTCHADDPQHVHGTATCKGQVLHRFKGCNHSAPIACHVLRFANGEPKCTWDICERRLKCGHPCQEKCGDLCTDQVGTCAYCIQRKNEEALLALSAAEVQRERIIEDIRRHVEILRKRMADAAGSEFKRTPMVWKDGVGDRNAESVASHAVKSIQAFHGFSLIITGIEQVEAPQLEAALCDAATTLHLPSITQRFTLYHGTKMANVDGILKNGFKIGRARNMAAGASHSRNMFGAAVYLCPDSSKAAQEQYTGKDGQGALLVCDVILGQVKEMAAADLDADLAAKRRAERYDSIFCRRSTAIMFDEYAVFNPACVLPRYIIHFQRVKTGGGASGATLARSIITHNLLPVYQAKRSDGTVVRWFDVTADEVRHHRDDELAREFERASARFTTLQSVTGSAFHDKRLVKVTVCINDALELQYAKAKSMLESRGFPTLEAFVFHGTPSTDAIKSIQTEGFKIGGLDGHGITNGQVRGFGIYTGETPEVSRGYTQGLNCMLLLRVLPGKETSDYLSRDDCSMNDRVVQEGGVQSHRSEDAGVRILASPHLVLPRWVLHWA